MLGGGLVLVSSRRQRTAAAAATPSGARRAASGRLDRVAAHLRFLRYCRTSLSTSLLRSGSAIEVVAGCKQSEAFKFRPSMPFDFYRAQGKAEPFSGQESLIGVQRREGTWQPLTLLLPMFVSRTPKMAVINEQRASH
jgi:hypothetical protein